MGVGVPTNFRSNIWICIIPLLLLLLLPFLLYLLPQLSSAPVTTMPPVVPTPAPMPMPTEPYDCKSQGLWSFDKKGWCCKHYGTGCPTTHPPTPAPRTTSPCPFDCNAGYNEWPLQWVKGWSGAKKIYCCKTVQRGCASELPPPSGLPPSGLPPAPDTGPYDCNAGYHPCFHCLQHQWSPSKLSWCWLFKCAVRARWQFCLVIHMCPIFRSHLALPPCAKSIAVLGPRDVSASQVACT